MTRLRLKVLRTFQQLDHALQQSPGAAAIEAAMIEAQGDLRFGHRNKLRFRFIPARRLFAGAKTQNHGLIGEGDWRAPFHPKGAEIRDCCDSATLHFWGNATSAP